MPHALMRSCSVVAETRSGKTTKAEGAQLGVQSKTSAVIGRDMLDFIASQSIQMMAVLEFPIIT